jgi:hypothetical protein
MLPSCTPSRVSLCAVTHPPHSDQLLRSILNCIAAGDKRDDLEIRDFRGFVRQTLGLRDAGVYEAASAGRDRQKSSKANLPQRSDVRHMHATADGLNAGLCSDKPTNNYLDYCSK